MTLRIAHLSDVHFGGENPAAVEAAIDAVAAFAPTLTVLTGDLTLNGLPKEFLSAGRWLQRLPPDRLVTPGNHDTPYWNLVLRTLTPFDRYRRYIGDPRQAAFDAPGLTARAVNSAGGAQPRLDWSKGVMPIKRLRRLDWGPETKLKLFGCHHPLIDPVGAPVTGGVHHGAQAAALLAASGVELVLSGHTHVAFALPLHEPGGRSYALGAGTLSLRTRGTPPSFSTITARQDAFEVQVQAWTGDRFEPEQSWSLPRRASP